MSSSTQKKTSHSRDTFDFCLCQQISIPWLMIGFMFFIRFLAAAAQRFTFEYYRTTVDRYGLSKREYNNAGHAQPNDHVQIEHDVDNMTFVVYRCADPSFYYYHCRCHPYEYPNREAHLLAVHSAGRSQSDATTALAVINATASKKVPARQTTHFYACSPCAQCKHTHTHVHIHR